MIDNTAGTDARLHPGRIPPGARALLALLLSPALAALLACGDDDGPTDPGPPPEPSTGSIEVTTATSGAEPDPDGYTVTVDGEGQGRTIGVEDTVVVEDVAEGEHSVELSNLADNCGVLEPENPRTVSVAAGDTASAHFAVACEGGSAIEVTTSTVAGGLDEDGFQVAVDGGEERTIGTDDTEVFSGLASGDHMVELSGLATGCSVSGDNPRDVTVAADESATAAFEASCGLRDRIVFSSIRDGNFDIWVMEADGSNPEPLFESAGLDGSPAVSPDGARIAFASERAPGVDDFDIRVMEADGSNPENITPGEGNGSGPAWSPDGSRIAFGSRRDGNNEIYVMEADGSRPERLTEHAASDFDPAWSPDGSRIAFASTRDAGGEIYVMEADGSNPTRLTENDASDFDPAWSPDGSRILFRSLADGASDIYVACVNGSKPPEPLTGTDGFDTGPAWSPDGARIAFASSSDGTTDIWTMGTDGSGATNLTDHPDGDRDPSWSPQTTLGPGPGPAPSPECQVVAP